MLIIRKYIHGKIFQGHVFEKRLSFIHCNLDSRWIARSEFSELGTWILAFPFESTVTLVPVHELSNGKLMNS